MANKRQHSRDETTSSTVVRRNGGSTLDRRWLLNWYALSLHSRASALFLVDRKGSLWFILPVSPGKLTLLYLLDFKTWAEQLTKVLNWAGNNSAQHKESILTLLNWAGNKSSQFFNALAVDPSVHRIFDLMISCRFARASDFFGGGLDILSPSEMKQWLS